jgi:hypothetical protein
LPRGRCWSCTFSRGRMPAAGAPAQEGLVHIVQAHHQACDLELNTLWRDQSKPEDTWLRAGCTLGLKLRSMEPARLAEGSNGDSTALQWQQASMRRCCQAPVGRARCCSSQLLIEQLEVQCVVSVQMEAFASCAGRQFWVMMHVCVRDRVVCCWYSTCQARAGQAVMLVSTRHVSLQFQ